MLEETGIKCKVLEHTVSVVEYFIDSIWKNNYFICDYIEDTGERALTEEEKDLELEVRWLTVYEILDIFENNMTLHENGPMVQNREFLGLINSI